MSPTRQTPPAWGSIAHAAATTDGVSPEDSLYAVTLDRLADAVGFPHDEDPIAIFDAAAERLTHGDLVTGEEAADLPDGSVVIRVHPDTHQPFPLGSTGAHPQRIGEWGTRIAVGDDTICYRVLLRAPYREHGPAVGDVISGEYIEAGRLPEGTRYVLCDEQGDPAPYGIVLEARDNYLPSVIMRGGQYVILTGPES